MENFRYDNLKPLEGQSVEAIDANSGEKIADLSVQSVEKSAPDGDLFEAFTVTLKGDEDAHLGQGIYRLKAEAFGEQEVFITPNAIDRYHVCVSIKKANA